LQKYSNLGLVTPENTRPVSVGTADTIISDMDEPLKQLLQYSTPEHLPESTTSTPHSTLYHEINDSELARALNCDLALNHLTTLDTPSKIWLNLNNRCIEKFGSQNCIKNNATISNITWVKTTLSGYRNWNMMRNYYDDIDRWIVKINNFCKLNLSNKIVLDYKIL
jgi:hypothetical protein